MFEKVHSFDILYECHVSIFKSQKSGLHIVHVDPKSLSSGLVHGKFIVPTETFSNAGYPHTLEHLVFMGSQSYPYKGIVSKLANRCFAQGTNAWTEQNSTVYTLSTAGSEGFLQILPVYADHVLFPELSDEAFITEVHHITPEGNNAGVVYSEMQARENTSDDLSSQVIQRELFSRKIDPKTKSVSYVNGYAYNTGGLMADLRQLTNEAIRKYHASYYTPKNITLLVVGELDCTDLFNALHPIEEKLETYLKQTSDEKMETAITVRPFIDTLPRLVDSQALTIQYPDDQEEIGSIIVGWRGPVQRDCKCAMEKDTASGLLKKEKLGAQFTECQCHLSPQKRIKRQQASALTTADYQEQMLAFEFLVEYLESGPNAPLVIGLVENESPYCSEVSSHIDYRRESGVYLSFHGCKMKKIKDLATQIHLEIKKVYKNKLDMDRLRDIINVHVQRVNNAMEKSLEHVIDSFVIPHVIYGNNLTEFERAFRRETFIEPILNYKESDWKAILKTYFISAHHVTVISEPSLAKAEDLKTAESERVAAQRASLSPTELALKGESLKRALEKNNIPPPDDIVHAFAIPDLAKVKSLQTHLQHTHFDRIPNASCEYFKSKNYPCLKNLEGLPIRFQIDDYTSAFCNATVFIDTQNLSPDLRTCLPLFMDIFYELDMRSEDTGSSEIISYKEVTKILDREFVEYSGSIGLGGHGCFAPGPVPSLIQMSIKAAKERLPLVLKWIKKLLFDTVYSNKRLKVSLERMYAEIQLIKSDANAQTNMLINGRVFNTPRSTIFCSNPYRQEAFISQYFKPSASDMEGNSEDSEDSEDSGDDSEEDDSEEDDSEDEDDLEVSEEEAASYAKLTEKLYAVRKALFVPENFWIHLSGNLTGADSAQQTQEHPARTLSDLLLEHMPRAGELKAPQMQQHNVLVNPDLYAKNVIYPLKSAESTYLTHCTRGVTSFADPDIPAILVLQEYMTADEGVLWSEVRGKGLAYGIGLHNIVEKGLINLKIRDSTDIFGAYQGIQRIMSEFLSGERVFEQHVLDAAKSSCIFEEFESHDSYAKVAAENFLEINLTERGANYLQQILPAIQRVTLGDLKRVLHSRFAHIAYTANTSTIAIVCPPNKIDGILLDFKKHYGCVFEIVTDIQAHYTSDIASLL